MPGVSGINPEPEERMLECGQGNRQELEVAEKHCEARQHGFGMLTALIAVSLVSVIGLYLSLVATSQVRISDNHESQVRARAAAIAGLHHAGELLAALEFDELLAGPDGVYDSGAGYLASARKHSYRNPIPWSAARMLDLWNPAVTLAGIPDDGLIHSGHPAGAGTVLIPLSGILLTIPNHLGEGDLANGRYCVKVSDNNGDASELAYDPADNPFVDGDGEIILRSMGIARTLTENAGAGERKNSVVLYEGRFKRLSTFEFNAALVVQGSVVEPAAGAMFAGSQFNIQGGALNPGMAALDTLTGDGISPAAEIESRLSEEQRGRVEGAGLIPSIRDITAAVAAHPDKSLLLDAPASWKFIREEAPEFADGACSGSQSWIGSAPFPLGRYDPLLPQSSPLQDPRVTFVDGDLLIDGNVDGAGLLVVTGKLTIAGSFVFQGIILILGEGELECGGTSSISGAVYLAAISDASGVPVWGVPKLTVQGSTSVTHDPALVRMAVRLIPPVQRGFREITRIIDP